MDLQYKKQNEFFNYKHDDKNIKHRQENLDLGH